MGPGYCITCGKKFSSKPPQADVISTTQTAAAPIVPPAPWDPAIPALVPPIPHPAIAQEGSPSRIWDSPSPEEPNAAAAGAMPEAAGPISERRSWSRIALAGALTIALAIGGLVFAFSRNSQQSSGSTFVLAFARNESFRFHLYNRITGTFSASAIGFNQPVDLVIDETVLLRVVSVDRDGVATAQVEVEDATGKVNGEAVPAPSGTRLEMRIAPDGRILESNGVTFGSEGGSGNAFPGTDQFMPVLPDGKVSPGDKWSKNFTVAFPFGTGAIHYETHNQLLRYEPLNGVRAAVIESDIKSPFKLTMDPRKFFQAAGVDRSELPDGFRGTLRYRGGFEALQTAWFDPVSREALKTTARATIDLRLTLEGFPGADQVGEIRLLGTLDSQFDNLTPASAAPS
jgi:hypothetical protein